MPSEHKTNETIKYKLATAMKECMKSASVEKITVTEIVETCGVTRQTFYRNFKDKYDLIDCILIKFYWNLSNIWVKGKLCMKDW